MARRLTRLSYYDPPSPTSAKPLSTLRNDLGMAGSSTNLSEAGSTSSTAGQLGLGARTIGSTRSTAGKLGLRARKSDSGTVVSSTNFSAGTTSSTADRLEIGARKSVSFALPDENSGEIPILPSSPDDSAGEVDGVMVGGLYRAGKDGTDDSIGITSPRA